MTFCLQCKLKAFAFYPQGKRITALALNTAKRLVAFTEYKSPHPIKFLFKIKVGLKQFNSKWCSRPLIPLTKSIAFDQLDKTRRHTISPSLSPSPSTSPSSSPSSSPSRFGERPLLIVYDLETHKRRKILRCAGAHNESLTFFILFTLFTILNNNNFPQSLKVTQLWASRSVMTQSIY